MSESTLPSDWKCCATCACWAGCTSADYHRLWVTYQESKGRCCGGGFNGLEMNPMESCSSWEQRFVSKK